MRKTENFELNLMDGDDFVNKDTLNENTKKVEEVLKQHENPEYDVSEQEEVEELTSGESLKTAFRKLARAVKELIAHMKDTAVHFTEEERKKLAGIDEEANKTVVDSGLSSTSKNPVQNKVIYEKIKNLTTTKNAGVQVNIDFNDVVAPGLFQYAFYCTTEERHAPELNTTFYVYNICRDENDMEQFAVAEGKNKLYYRTRSTGTWGEWAEILTSEHIANNFVTTDQTMIAAAPLVKQLYEENQSLKEQISALNTNVNDLQTSNRYMLIKNRDIPAQGWYRIARYINTNANGRKGAADNSVDIILKRTYNLNPNEHHELKFMSIWNNHKFVSTANLSNVQLFTKMRYTSDGFLEIYYNGTKTNTFSYTILNRYDGGLSGYWVDVWEESNTTDDEVLCSFDIPAN